jgi:LPS-assembly lipoprotein
MIFTRTLISLFTALFILSGCGFTPMYAENQGEGLSEAFSNVAIAPMNDRIGQVVQNHLQDRMNPYGSPAAPEYLLRVTLNEALEGYGFRTDEAVTRESFTLTATYQLVDQQSGDVVLQDEVRAIQAYDVVQSDFANFSSQQDAEARTALQIAELVTARVGLYLKSEE